jgi:hypothetical protein
VEVAAAQDVLVADRQGVVNRRIRRDRTYRRVRGKIRDRKSKGGGGYQSGGIDMVFHVIG